MLVVVVALAALAALWSGCRSVTWPDGTVEPSPVAFAASNTVHNLPSPPMSPDAGSWAGWAAMVAATFVGSLGRKLSTDAAARRAAKKAHSSTSPVSALLLVFLLARSVMAADVALSWHASTGATGYKVYYSTNAGSAWALVRDVGSVTNTVATNVTDTVLVLFRVAAYNVAGESIRYESGAWYDGRLRPPVAAGGLGIP